MARAVPSPRGKSTWWFSLLLAGLVGAVFWPVWQFDFVRWDDDINITQNPLLTRPWSWSLVAQFFSGEQALRFKPLHWFFNRGLHAVFGFDPRGWHAANLALHFLATLLFFRVVVRVLTLRSGEKNDRRMQWAAFFAAALWAVHPLRTEPVAWATASPYLLTAVGLLGSFIFYFKAYEQPTATRRWLIWSWILAVASYASYPVSITYGLWLMATDQWLLPRRTEPGSSWTPGFNVHWCVKQALFLLPAIAAVAVTLWTRFTAPGIFGVAPAVGSVDLWSRGRMALAALGDLVRRCFWPAHLTPNLPPLPEHDAINVEVMVVGLLALSALLLAWIVRQKRPGIALVVLGFAAISLPCLGWTEWPAWPVDRYSYVPHFILIGGIAGGLWHWSGRRRRHEIGLFVLGVVGLALSAFFSRKQAMIWRDSEALFTHMENHPGFSTSPRQQGHVYILWAYYEGAHARNERAGALFGKARHVYYEAMRAAVKQGDFAEALALLTHWERYFPLPPEMRREKGFWLLQVGRPEAALSALRSAEAELPGDLRSQSLREEAEQKLKVPPAAALP